MLEAAEWYIKASLAVAVGFALLSQAEDVVAAWRQTRLREEHERRLAARCAACDAHAAIIEMCHRLAAGQTLDASATVDADGHADLALRWTTEEEDESLDPEDAIEEAEQWLKESR